jgi:alpha-L-rhamnosidase
MAADSPHSLRVEGLEEPLGITEREPFLSWRTGSPQVAYRLEVIDDRDGQMLFDSGRRVGAERRLQLTDVGWRSRQRLRWTVRTWSDLDGESSAPAQATWEMGLLDHSDWQARWIGYADPGRVTGEPEHVLDAQPPPYMRREFAVDTHVAAARLHVTALGLFEVWINGARVGAQLLAPGWTQYEQRIEVRTFDVTELVRSGANVIAATVADGWFAGHVAFFGRAQYGDTPALLAQLELELSDGSKWTIVTDHRWRAATGAIRAADLIMGESVDLAADHGGWRQPGFDDADWAEAQERAWADVALVRRVGADVEVIADLEPRSIRDGVGGVILVDVGQNISGHLEVAWDARAGEPLTLRHGEELTSDGELYTANLRTARQCDQVIPAADGPTTYAPSFAFHGFRYAELSGVDRTQVRRVRARAISTALPRAGAFSCSDPLLQQLQSNILWSQRDNFVDVPTDCPQRDERVGWAGDVQIFAPTAAFNADVEAFLTRWLDAMIDAQHPSGGFPDFAPLRCWSGHGNAGWADAAVIVPWLLHERYDNRRLLSRMYPALQRYVDFLERDSTDGFRLAGRYGEWVPLEQPTPSALVGTAYLARTAGLMSSIASALDFADDATRYRAQRDRAVGAFRRAFIDDRKALREPTQTGYVLSLAFDLIPGVSRVQWAQNLVELIETTGHLATGFLGTPLALPVLSDHGHHELACQLAQKDTFPSWGFTIRQGATTIWERWDGRSEDGEFHGSEMNSLNHYSLGSVGDWMYRYLGGLRSRLDGPGYRRWTAAPMPGGTIEWARTRYLSAYGEHVLEWERDGDSLAVEVHVPHGTEAVLTLPGEGAAVPPAVGAGSHRFATKLGTSAAAPASNWSSP